MLQFIGLFIILGFVLIFTSGIVITAIIDQSTRMTTLGDIIAMPDVCQLPPREVLAEALVAAISRIDNSPNRSKRFCLLIADLGRFYERDTSRSFELELLDSAIEDQWPSWAVRCLPTLVRVEASHDQESSLLATAWRPAKRWMPRSWQATSSASTDLQPFAEFAIKIRDRHDFLQVAYYFDELRKESQWESEEDAYRQVDYAAIADIPEMPFLDESKFQEVIHSNRSRLSLGSTI